MKYILLVLFLGNFTLAFAQNFTVNFNSNEHVIPDTAVLPLVLYILKEKPDSVHIYGHCDSIGSDVFNLQLSQRRAQAVKNLCLANTITNKSISIAVGKGEKAPKAGNDSELGRFMNRRVEVFFYKKSEIQAAESVVKVVEKAATPLLKELPSLIVKKEIVVKKDEVFVLPSIRFNALSHDFTPESQIGLTELLKVMKENKTMKILVMGHVCCTTFAGQDGDDMALGTSNLSVTRAKAVREYLIKEGIEPSRLGFMGMKGDKKLYPDEKTTEEKDANRRVEFKIMSI
jgi:outer membrane protein OmpA-like peptidoglycan-associated protein